MNLKQSRWNKIKGFLRLQSTPVTLTEIHDALVKRLHIEVCRKTVERDIMEMQEREIVYSVEGIPSRYLLQKGAEIEIVLNVDEVSYLLGILNAEHHLYHKLKKFIE